jgi:hypothetical protein
VPHSAGVSKQMVGSSQMLAEEDVYTVVVVVVYSVYVISGVVSYGVSGLVMERVGGPVRKVMLRLSVDVAVP